MEILYIAYDCDNAGRLIGQSRLRDDPEGLARISNTIDAGNELFRSWALEHGGSQISAGGDEGVISIPATALADLQMVKEKYESLLSLTVSIGVGVKMSDSFKALLASKLRGKNRTTMYDKDVEKDIQEASKKEEDSEQKKLVDEYLTKHQPIHHTGDGGAPASYSVQEQSMNPEIQGQQQIQDMPHYEQPENPEDVFRQLADSQEQKDQAVKATKSQDINALKQKVSQSLEAIHKQLPQLAEIKQAAPETYAAVLGVVQGLIAIGRQLSDSDQQLQKAIGSKRVWIGGGTRIPALGTPERQLWDNNYKQAVANYFTDGKPHLLKPVKVPVASLEANHFVSGNEAKTRLYHRMVRAGDKMPPMVLGKEGKGYRVIDGNRRLNVALENGLTHVDAWLLKGEVDVNHNPNLPPTGMLGTSSGGLVTYDLGLGKTDLMPGGEADHLRPEDFDQEQLAIGTQHELEHTEDIDLAREIAMDHLAEDPDYYKEDTETKPPLAKAIEDIPPGIRLKNPVKDNKGKANAGELAGYDLPKVAPQSYDYNHLLTPEQKAAGYSLFVDKYPIDSKTRSSYSGDLVSKLFYKGKRVGNVFAGLAPIDGGGTPRLEPHSELAKEHQGKGFGVKMYEALYSHAKHIEGVDVVRGGPHSEAAHRVHVSLAKKHGLNYVGAPFSQKMLQNQAEYPYKHYTYALKAELGPNDQLDENNLGTVQFGSGQEKEELDPAKAPPPDKVLDKAGMPEEVKSMKAHHKLIPGQVLDSRHLVVQNANGKNVVREVSSGQQRDLNDQVSNPIGPGQGNPTSTRNKPSRT